MFEVFFSASSGKSDGLSIGVVSLIRSLESHEDIPENEGKTIMRSLRRMSKKGVWMIGKKE
jgi:hypothetical protein